jgi:hypothetical protein
LLRQHARQTLGKRDSFTIATSFEHTTDRGAKSLLGHRFDEVVESVSLERARGVRIERRDKNNCRHLRRTNLAHNVKPSHPWHLDIEKNDSWLERVHRANRISTVATFGDDLKLRMRFEQLPDATSRQRFVVNNERSNWCHALGAHLQPIREPHYGNRASTGSRSQLEFCLRPVQGVDPLSDVAEAHADAVRFARKPGAVVTNTKH